MTAPDATMHDPRPDTLRALIARAGHTQASAARRIGVSARMMRYYLADDPGAPRAPYPVQYALERLAD